MDKELAVQFLTQEAIKKQEKREDRLWDAIYKAHRDTMTGARSGNIDGYCSANKNGANKTLELLYQAIRDKAVPLCSEELIDDVKAGTGETVEFAAIQKLVNMTLKYIIILNLFEQSKGFAVDVCEEHCDCPIDSIILERLRKCIHISHTCWTKIGEPEYRKVQNEIRDYLAQNHPDKKGNIWFDFLMWKTE